jgi:hypothetical protein
MSLIDSLKQSIQESSKKPQSVKKDWYAGMLNLEAVQGEFYDIFSVRRGVIPTKASHGHLFDRWTGPYPSMSKAIEVSDAQQQAYRNSTKYLKDLESLRG